MNHPDLVAIVARLQDDIVYILEELMCDSGGEARRKLREVLARLPGQAGVLGEGLAARLHAQLEPVLMQLRESRPRATATLVGIRRGLRNLQLRLQEQDALYPWAREMGWAAQVTATVAH